MSQVQTALPGELQTLELEPAGTRALAVSQEPLPAVRAPVTPADLLRIAMERDDKDIDRLERLMAMDERYREAQERDRKREAELAFRRDFARLRGENIVIPKTKLVDQKKRDGGQGPRFMQSEYDVVMGMLSPALSKHGFGLRHDQKFTSKPWTTAGEVNDVPWVVVTCYLEHRDGHTETLTLEGPPDDSGAKNPLQEMQSSASFLKRQSALAITGTATGGEDDEGKMRGRRGRQGGEDADASEGLIAAGDQAALGGTEALSKWWGGLDGKQRNTVGNAYFGMRRRAREADEGGAP